MTVSEDSGRRLRQTLPILMLLTHPTLFASLRAPVQDEHEEFLRGVVRHGVNFIQVRRPSTGRSPALDLQHFSDAAADAIHGHGHFLIHFDVDVACSTEAAGVHLPEGVSQQSRLQSRKRLGKSRWLSCSVHSPGAATQAERDGADMLVLGTVFPSRSHPGGPTIGIEGVREVCASVTIPMIGIGGISAENAGDVIRAGASGVAVISAIFDAPDPRAAAAELRAVIDAAWAERGSEN